MPWGGHENQVRGSRSPKARLDEEKVLEMRQLYAEGGMTQVELAEKYGVALTTVWYALHRQTWKHVGPFYNEL